MRIWKLIYYTTGEQYETSEFYIDEPKFRQYQKAILEGSEFLVLEDRVIKTKMIKEILPAEKEVEDYLRQGVRPDLLGLPKNFKIAPPKEDPGFKKIEGFKKI